MKYTFSNDMAEVFPRSSHRAIITNWTAIKPPNIYDDDEVEINSLYSVSSYMQEEDKMREECKEDEGHKKGNEREEKKGHKKGKEREEGKGHKKGKEREEGKGYKKGKEREGKGHKKGKEREERKWHKKNKEREESEEREENKELVGDEVVGDEVVIDEEPKKGEKREESKGGVDGKDGRFNQKTSDDQESTHSTGSGAKNIETPSGSVPSLPLQGSIPGTRGKLTKAMAEKSLEIMTVEDPKESDIVIP